MRAMLESERQLLMEKYESYSDQNRRVHDENNKTKVELDHVKLHLEQREAELSSSEERHRYKMIKEQSELDLLKVRDVYCIV